MWQYSCQLRGFHVSSEPFAECSKLRAGSSGWFSRTNDLVTFTLRQFQQIHRIPWTAALLCRVGYVFALSLFHAETFQRQKLLQHALGVDGSYAWFARGWATWTWSDSVFTIWRSPCRDDQRKTFVTVYCQMQRAALEGSACTIGHWESHMFSHSLD